MSNDFGDATNTIAEAIIPTDTHVDTNVDTNVDTPIAKIDDGLSTSEITSEQSITEESQFFQKYKTLKKRDSLLRKSKPKRFDSAEYFISKEKLKK